MGLSRRGMLKIGVLGAGAPALPLERTVRPQTAGRMVESNQPEPSAVPFVVPPTLAPYRRDDTTNSDWDRGRYLVHHHNVVHEDHYMMTQFEVGEDGDDPMRAAPPVDLPGPPL